MLSVSVAGKLSWLNRLRLRICLKYSRVMLTGYQFGLICQYLYIKSKENLVAHHLVLSICLVPSNAGSKRGQSNGIDRDSDKQWHRKQVISNFRLMVSQGILIVREQVVCGSDTESYNAKTSLRDSDIITVKKLGEKVRHEFRVLCLNTG